MSSPCVQRMVVIREDDPLGLHLRPAKAFSQLALRFKSEIEVVRENLRVDAKSIINVLTLGAGPGVKLTLEARGEDAQQAIDALARFIESGFVVDEKECPSPAE